MVNGDADDAYSTTIVNQVVETRQALLTNNAQYDDRYKAGQSIILRGLRAILCAPMLTKERLVGVVYVDTSMRSGMFSEADRELLMAVAGQAAIAIENARLYGVAVEKGRLERELQVAREMQEALIPGQLPDYPGMIWRQPGGRLAKWPVISTMCLSWKWDLRHCGRRCVG